MSKETRQAILGMKNFIAQEQDIDQLRDAAFGVIELLTDVDRLIEEEKEQSGKVILQLVGVIETASKALDQAGIELFNTDTVKELVDFANKVTRIN